MKQVSMCRFEAVERNVRSTLWQCRRPHLVAGPDRWRYRLGLAEPRWPGRFRPC